MNKKWRWLFPSEVFLSFAGSTALTSTAEKVFAIPARLLVELPSYRIIALGDEAREVEHAGVGRSRVVSPCSDIEIFDERGAEVFLRGLLRIVLGSGFLLKPRVWLGIPGRVTPFMRELWLSVLLSAGARDVVLVNVLLAVAAGSGLPLHDGHGYVVGIVTPDGVALGLVAFGHVQHEIWKPFLAESMRSDQDIYKVVEKAWQELLQIVPSEFLGSLQQEGVVLAVADDSVEWSQAYTKTLGVPVATVDHTTVVFGLRRLAEEKSV